MTKLIISAIIVVGTAFVLIFKRWGTTGARRDRLFEELADVVEEMENMQKYEDSFNFADYHKLSNRRVRINEQLARLNR